MMTLILIVSFLLIVFIGMLRYDIHKHKYVQPKKNDADSSSGSSETANDRCDGHGSDISSDGGD